MNLDSIQRAVSLAVAAGAVSVPTAVPTVPGSFLLIDGDGLNYSCAGNDETSPRWARERVNQAVQSLVNATGAEQVIMEMSTPGGSKRHRHAIATVKPYQGQRKSHRPKNWQHLRDFLQEDQPLWVARNWSDREADDGIAYDAAYYAHLGAKVFIASADKDLRMVPGWHVWPDVMVEVKPDDYDVFAGNDKQYGRKWFYLQMLMGDSVDNIPGLPRIMSKTGKLVLCGEKTAHARLAECINELQALDEVCLAYEGYYGDDWSSALVEQAALLWLSCTHDASDWVPPEFAHYNVLTDAAARLKERVYALEAE